jgi:hypothetical protein
MVFALAIHLDGAVLPGGCDETLSWEGEVEDVVVFLPPGCR